jgi:hypothetical protein
LHFALERSPPELYFKAELRANKYIAVNAASGTASNPAAEQDGNAQLLDEATRKLNCARLKQLSLPSLKLQANEPLIEQASYAVVPGCHEPGAFGTGCATVEEHSQAVPHLPWTRIPL